MIEHTVISKEQWEEGFSYGVYQLDTNRLFVTFQTTTPFSLEPAIRTHLFQSEIPNISIDEKPIDFYFENIDTNHIDVLGLTIATDFDTIHFQTNFKLFQLEDQEIPKEFLTKVPVKDTTIQKITMKDLKHDVDNIQSYLISQSIPSHANFYENYTPEFIFANQEEFSDRIPFMIFIMKDEETFIGAFVAEDLFVGKNRKIYKLLK